DLAVGVVDRRNRERDLNSPTVLSHPFGLEVIDAFAAADGGQNPGDLVGALDGNEAGDRLPEHLLGGVSEDAFGAGIPTGDDAVEVLTDHRIVATFDDRSEHLVALGKRLLGLFAVSDLGIE